MSTDNEKKGGNIKQAGMFRSKQNKCVIPVYQKFLLMYAASALEKWTFSSVTDSCWQRFRNSFSLSRKIITNIVTIAITTKTEANAVKIILSVSMRAQKHT